MKTNPNTNLEIVVTTEDKAVIKTQRCFPDVNPDLVEHIIFNVVVEPDGTITDIESACSFDLEEELSVPREYIRDIQGTYNAMLSVIKGGKK